MTLGAVAFDDARACQNLAEAALIRLEGEAAPRPFAVMFLYRTRDRALERYARR
jgi:hypothetical protein